MAHCYIAILLLTVKLFDKTYGVGYVNLAIFEQYTPDYVPCMHVRIDLAAKRNGSYDGMDRLFCVYHQEYELCYCFDKIPDREDSFQAAQQNCIDIDGQLAVIDTKDKLLILSSIMFSLYLNGEFYIGLERMDGHWTWLEEEGYRAAGNLEFLDENIGDKYGIIIKTDTDCPLEIECDEIHFWPQFEKKKRKKRTAEVDAGPFDYGKLVSLVESHKEYDYKQYSQDSGDFEGGYSGYDLYGDWELPTDIFGSAGFGTTDGSWNGNISENFRYICTTKPDHEYAAAYKDAFYANWYATYGYYEGYGKYYVPPEYYDDGYEDETQVEQKFVSYGYRGNARTFSASCRPSRHFRFGRRSCRMSFQSLPPEMLMKVFSFVTDVGCKIQLQRVNKQWLMFLKKPQSWALNTRLSIKMGLTTTVFNPRKQHRENMTLLEYAPKITFLKFHGTNEDPKFDDSFLEKLWANEHKLRFEHLEIMNTDDKPCKNEYMSFLIRIMSRPTIKNIEFFCCLSPVCRLRETFAQQLRLRPHLRKLKWLSLPLAAQDTVSAALKDLPIESLRLEIQGDHQWLATVVNAAKDNSVRELEIPEDVGTFKERELSVFLRALSPSATDAIKVLKLDGGVSDLFEILPTLPTTFPNLTTLESTYSPPSNNNLLQPPKIAEKIGDLMRCNRDVPLNAWIRVVSFGKWQFSRNLWSAIGSLGACKSGTKRATGERRWKRILEENNVKVCVENEWGIE